MRSRALSGFLFSLFYFPFSACASAQDTSWYATMLDARRAHQERRYADAERLARQALTLAQDFAPADPNLRLALRNLVVIHAVQGRASDAEKLLQQFLLDRERALGPASDAFAATVLAVARAARETRQHEMAERFLKRALALREKISAPDDIKLAPVLEEFAVLHLTWQRVRNAPVAATTRAVSAPYAGSVIQDSSRSSSSPPRRSGVPYPQPARTMLVTDYAAAEKYARRALAIREAALGANHIELAPVLANLLGPACLGQSGRDSRKLVDAVAAYERALAIYEKSRALPIPRWAELLSDAAARHHAADRFKEADTLFRLAISIYEKIHGPDARQLIVPLRSHAAMLRAAGRTADADRVEARASSIAAKFPPAL
jgi:tetratricopeptide (TPR) repeat protein